jgi:hypothetical protein
MIKLKFGALELPNVSQVWKVIDYSNDNLYRFKKFYKMVVTKLYVR